MPHRNPFKPMKDRPSLDEVMEAGRLTPRSVIELCRVVSQTYATDPVSPIHHPSVEKGRV